MCPKYMENAEFFFMSYHSTYRNFNDFFDSFKKALGLYTLIYSRVICFYKLRQIRQAIK